MLFCHYSLGDEDYDSKAFRGFACFVFIALAFALWDNVETNQTVNIDVGQGGTLESSTPKVFGEATLVP